MYLTATCSRLVAAAIGRLLLLPAAGCQLPATVHTHPHTHLHTHTHTYIHTYIHTYPRLPRLGGSVHG